jgi:TM2 domain-containing membrane protein YozV
MRSITRLLWICSFLCSAFSGKAQQDGNFSLPDSLSGNSARARALLGKAGALKQLGEFADAVRVLQRISHEKLDDTLSCSVSYQVALCTYLQGEHARAQDALEQLYLSVADSTLTAPSLMLYALALNEERKWSEAKDKMLKMISCSKLDPAAADSLTRMVNEMYDPRNYPKLKNVKAAKVLSFIIPGSGQVYAGSVGQGIASMVLQAAAITFTVYSFNAGTYITSAGAGFSVFGRLYGGGGRNAERIAMRTNYERAMKYNDQLKKQVIAITRMCSKDK